ncbi:MAG: NAD(P)H-quinone oxidoreductase [Silvibacterium sp.]|nr:NAD(P)H-quinone oxidoreductase [Silvibacterium sp.]MBV8438552.1 NAD(P)H-quinone oxidoreductase [Silvibacterium sp.]
MRIIKVRAPGGPEHLAVADAPVPKPGHGEVLIKVAACGLNHADLYQREGKYPPPPGASPILGMEVSGTIAELGDGCDPRWKVGDRVCALLAGGGYAELCTAPAGQCLPIPSNIDLIDAAALPEAVFTVWANLFEPPRLSAGETLLVQGGSSGVGSTAIQIAVAFGARVAATAGSIEKVQFCLNLGCERAFNYHDYWFPAVRDWSQPHGIDAILDMVAGEYFPKHLQLLAVGGRLIHIATQRGVAVELDLRTVMAKRLLITGSTLRPRSVAEKTALRDSIEQQVWPLFAAGKIRPIVYSVFPMGEAAEAHQLMESSRHIGKILLRMD